MARKRRRTRRRFGGWAVWGRKGSFQGRARKVTVHVRIWRTGGGYCAEAADRKWTAIRGGGRREKRTAMVCGRTPRLVYSAALRSLAGKAA